MRTGVFSFFLIFILIGETRAEGTRVTPLQKPISPSVVGKNEQIWQASTAFEAVFVRQILQAMRKTLPAGGAVEESSEEKFYRSLLDAEYAEIIATRGDLGIADLVYESLGGTQEKRKESRP